MTLGDCVNKVNLDSGGEAGNCLTRINHRDHERPRLWTERHRQKGGGWDLETPGVSCHPSLGLRSVARRAVGCSSAASLTCQVLSTMSYNQVFIGNRTSKVIQQMGY